MNIIRQIEFYTVKTINPAINTVNYTLAMN